MLKMRDCTQKNKTDVLKVCDCTQKNQTWRPGPQTDVQKVCDCTQKTQKTQSFTQLSVTMLFFIPSPDQ